MLLSEASVNTFVSNHDVTASQSLKLVSEIGVEEAK